MPQRPLLWIWGAFEEASSLRLQQYLNQQMSRAFTADTIAVTVAICLLKLSNSFVRVIVVNVSKRYGETEHRECMAKVCASLTFCSRR